MDLSELVRERAGKLEFLALYGPRAGREGWAVAARELRSVLGEHERDAGPSGVRQAGAMRAAGGGVGGP
jgi:hypothetical protein